MALTKEYSPQIRNHPAPKNQPDGAASFPARSHSHAPFRNSATKQKTESLRSRLQTQNRAAPFLESGMERLHST
jgi:hypothetical protein